MMEITSVRNPRVQRWKSLREHKGRAETGCFLAEGRKLVGEAIQSGFAVEALLLCEDEPLPPQTPQTPVYRLPAPVFAAVCDTKTPQGIAAEVRIPERGFQPGRRVLALDGVQDPGNVGTLIRTADAAGFDSVLLSEACADVWSPKVIRAAMGSTFHLPIRTARELPEVLRALGQRGYALLATLLDGELLRPGEPIAASEEPLVLVMGSEGSGLSEPVRALCTRRLRLPMRGRAESLNVAVAGGILMYRIMEEALP